MENESYEHIIEELFGSVLLRRDTRQKCEDILDIPTNTFSGGIPYRILHGGFVAEQIIITLFRGKQIIIKIGKNPKLILDAERAIFVGQLVPDIVPSILQRGERVSPTGKKYWVIQEYLPGELGLDYLKSRHFTNEHRIKLARMLGKLHQTTQGGELFFGRAGPGAKKKYKTFSEYIGHFGQYIENSHYFPSETTEIILRGISFFENKVSSKVHVPCLIHGDFQERNILISDEGNCALIDFGDAKWSLREAEFATMLSHISEDRLREEFSPIIKTYEDEFGDLDKNLLDLFLLCCGSYKIAQRQEYYKQDGGMWNTIIYPILNRISAESNNGQEG